MSLAVAPGVLAHSTPDDAAEFAVAALFYEVNAKGAADVDASLDLSIVRDVFLGRLMRTHRPAADPGAVASAAPRTRAPPRRSPGGLGGPLSCGQIDADDNVFPCALPRTSPIGRNPN